MIARCRSEVLVEGCGGWLWCLLFLLSCEFCEGLVGLFFRSELVEAVEFCDAVCLSEFLPFVDEVQVYSDENLTL